MANTVPDWVTYPEADWQSLTPEEAGLDPARFQAFIDSLGIRGASFSVRITRTASSGQ